MDRKLLPKNYYDLVRIGSINDGGYLVEKKSIENSPFLIGLGILDDWNFEIHFGKPFIGIDNVLSYKFLFKRLIIKFLVVLKNPFQIKNIKNLIDYSNKINFYKKNIKCFKKIFVSNYDSKKTLSLNSILSNYNSNIFLKIDIEGSEYRILEQILQNEKIIEGLVIEFHDVDIHLEKIISFLNKSSLTLVHFHPNNFGGVDKEGNPLVIELTFSKNPKILSNGPPELPLKDDNPNNPFEKDILVNFER
jgi:hypothetical protein